MGERSGPNLRVAIRRLIVPRGGRRERWVRRVRDFLRGSSSRILSAAEPTSTPENPLAAPKRAGIIRVLFQVDDFLQGGMEQVILDIAASLDSSRFEPMLLICGQEGPLVRRARESGLIVLRLPTNDRCDAYRQLLKSYEIDVINAHFSLFGDEIAADIGVPFIQTIHNAYVWLDDAEVKKHQQADAHTTAYTCVSASVAAYATGRMLLSADKMDIISNGIDTKNFLAKGRSIDRSAARRELGIDEDAFVFLNMAAITPAKAQLSLIHAFAAVYSDDPNARLLLVGKATDEAYFADVKRAIEGLGLHEAVMVLGYQDEPSRFYFLADAFVLPSFWEGWSLALVEAYCAGLPVIVSDVGGARELNDQFGGELVQPPFKSIVELSLKRTFAMLEDPHPDYERRLAEAMRRVLEQKEKRSLLSAKDIETLDRTAAYGAYALLFKKTHREMGRSSRQQT